MRQQALSQHAQAGQAAVAGYYTSGRFSRVALTVSQLYHGVEPVPAHQAELVRQSVRFSVACLDPMFGESSADDSDDNAKGAFRAL